MLKSTMRSSYVAGTLMLSIGFWTVLQLGFFRPDFLDATRKVRLEQQHQDVSATHTLIRSQSTHNGEYFSIEMGGEPAMNPNIIPHPLMTGTWILVSQLRQETRFFAELVCLARFHEGSLRCDGHASRLPIAPTSGDKCTGDLEYVSLNEGPHDARVFYGPRKPYTVFGSNSRHTCFGQWVQDFRNLVEWGYETDKLPDEFSLAIELQRPPPWRNIEKNWFLFWDLDGQMYVHHDLVPDRVFAQVERSGVVGPNLGMVARTTDRECMKRYMPVVGPEFESIHQATNSLSLTMCSRYDTSCIPDMANTFIFTIFQHKKYHSFHAVYEPYVLVFEQVPPFKVYAMSKKPFWISGRRFKAGRTSEGGDTIEADHSFDNTTLPIDQMLYITSMSWKDSSQKYHGYMDDVLFIAFGIEDEETAAIDVTVGDLMSSLGFC